MVLCARRTDRLAGYRTPLPHGAVCLSLCLFVCLVLSNVTIICALAIRSRVWGG